MRIIAGSLKGRKLHPISGLSIRPTSDRLREAMFNILASKVNDSVVLELFAGTGALGIEALSRGARSAVFIDKNKKALQAIAKNTHSCSLNNQIRIIKWDIAKNLKCIRSGLPLFNLVFMDPPYNKNLVTPALQNLSRSNALADNAIVVVEHTPLEPINENIDGFSIIDQRQYGKTLVSFLNYDIKITS